MTTRAFNVIYILLMVACTSCLHNVEVQKAVTVSSDMRECETQLSAWNKIFTTYPKAGELKIISLFRSSYLTFQNEISRTIRVEVENEKSHVFYNVTHAVLPSINERIVLFERETSLKIDNDVIEQVLCDFLRKSTVLKMPKMKVYDRCYEQAHFYWQYSDETRCIVGTYRKPFVFDFDHFFITLKEFSKHEAEMDLTEKNLLESKADNTPGQGGVKSKP